MKVRQLLAGPLASLLLAMMGLPWARATEEPSLDLPMRATTQAIQTVLIAAGTCVDAADCDQKDIAMVSPKNKGIDLIVYGVTEPAVVQNILSAMTQHYFTLPRGISLHVRLFAHSHNDERKRSVLRSAPVFADMTLRPVE